MNKMKYTENEGECISLNENIAIIGGDLRVIKLAQMLSKDNFNVKVYGIEKAEELIKNFKIKRCDRIEQVVLDCNIIIGPMPFSKDGSILNAPYCKDTINIEELILKLKGKKLIAGSIKPQILEHMKNNNIEAIDLMNIEKLTILNTIATAEGTLQVAMEETDKTIYNSNVLILGFGRVGKVVADRFKKVGANVYCEARKQDDLAWAKTFGFYTIHLDNLDDYLNKFDIIINTIPAIILEENRLEKIKKECLIIDLASMPGGTNFEKAKELGIKTIHALALPGKVAPTTSAKFIKEILYDII